MWNNHAVTGGDGSKRSLLGICVVTAMLLLPYRLTWAQLDLACHNELRAYRQLDSHSTHADSIAAIAAMIACQDTNDANAYNRRHQPLAGEAARLTGIYFDIPEYHDEGRLIGDPDAQGKLLGPIAAIFASPFLAGTSRAWQIAEHGFPGMLAAIVVVNQGPGETLPSTYRNLHLKFGVNCIWLYLPLSANGVYSSDVTTLHFRAFVTAGTNDKKTCRKDWMGTSFVPLPPTDPHSQLVSGPLEVVAVKDPLFPNDADYPPVARFDTDNAGNPVLAFKCLDAFCEVLPPSAATGPEGMRVRTPAGLTRLPGNRPTWTVQSAPSVAAPLASPEIRNREIKAWHDEQELGYRDATYKWRPSGITATIVPNPAIADLDSASFFARWHKVATVTFHGAPPAGSSYEKWGFKNGDNVLYIGFYESWKAMLISPDGTPRYWSHVKRTRHFDVPVPATARFRWTGIDEGLWTQCGRACCGSDGAS